MLVLKISVMNKKLDLQKVKTGFGAPQHSN